MPDLIFLYHIYIQSGPKVGLQRFDVILYTVYLLLAHSVCVCIYIYIVSSDFETGVLSKSDEAILGVFERKILRAIFGHTNDNGEWRIKYNNELYTLYKESDILTYIKINRLKWAGHVISMEEQNATRRVLVAAVEGRRQRGRPKLR